MTLCPGEIEPATISVARRSLSPMRTWTGVRLPLLSSTHSVTGMPWVALSGLSCALLDATMPAGRNSSWAMGWPCFTVALKSANSSKTWPDSCDPTSKRKRIPSAVLLSRAPVSQALDRASNEDIWNTNPISRPRRAARASSSRLATSRPFSA